MLSLVVSGLGEADVDAPFIACHNTEKMGRSLHEGEPLRLLKNKHVKHLVQNMVWCITGEGSGACRYWRGSVFNVAEVGEAAEGGFKRFAAGPGDVFDPHIPIQEAPSFLGNAPGCRSFCPVMRPRRPWQT